jgi:hypothetical protein
MGMRTSPIVTVLQIFGWLVAAVAVVYACGFGLNQMWLTDPDLETKYPALVVKYTSASHIDAAVCGIAVTVSLFSFGLASLVAAIWKIEYHLQPKG